MTIVGVHGIWNRKDGLTPGEAAAALGEGWSASLAKGYRDAGLSDTAPRVVAAYYAHLLHDEAQGDAFDLDFLTPGEREWAWRWLVAHGVPDEAGQGPVTAPLRQGLDWLARRKKVAPKMVARIMCAFLRDVYVYTSRPAVRERCRQVVIEAIEEAGATVVVAHSLGSVVAYEALFIRTDLAIDLFVTVGSPLALPEAVFEGLVPEPHAGKGQRPPNVGRWVNIADPGDLIAVPARLGDRFDVDHHDEAYLGMVDFHRFDGYLSCGLTAAAIAPYV